MDTAGANEEGERALQLVLEREREVSTAREREMTGVEEDEGW